MFAIWTFSKFLLNKIFYYFFHTQKKSSKSKNTVYFHKLWIFTESAAFSQNITLPKFCPKLLFFFFLQYKVD